MTSVYGILRFAQNDRLGGKFTATKTTCPLEGEEQETLFKWAEMSSGRLPELSLMFHIPNGGQRKKSEAARLKAEGVKSGVPDIMLPVARGGYHGLFVEMKRQKGGRVEEAQREWLDRLSGQGYKAIVCKGWCEAAEKITAYLEGR